MFLHVKQNEHETQFKFQCYTVSEKEVYKKNVKDWQNFQMYVFCFFFSCSTLCSRWIFCKCTVGVKDFLCVSCNTISQNVEIRDRKELLNHRVCSPPLQDPSLRVFFVVLSTLKWLKQGGFHHFPWETFQWFNSPHC